MTGCVICANFTLLKTYKYFLSLLLGLLVVQTGCTQTKSVNGVYAGILLMPSVTMGGGMNRIDEVLLLRANGTFNDDLGKPDWQTRVTGKYTVSGKKLTLRYAKDNKTTDYSFDKDGNIDAGSYTMLKQPVDHIVPKGIFKFTMMNSSGGGSSGMVYVGTSNNETLNFDGNGHFSNNSASASVIAGEGVGGGGSRENSGKGNYTITKGVLMLKYDNGQTKVHSFFCRPSYNPIMAVIDGDIYFMEDENKKHAGEKAAAAEKRPNRLRNNQSPTTTETPAANNTDGKAMLLKANEVHGGSALNNINTVSFAATTEGIEVTSYVDVPRRRVRFEARQGGKLLQIEQLEGQSGWQWRGGQISTLPAARATEMAAAFYSGILGLRQSQINAAAIKSVKPVQNGYAIVCEQNGKNYAFILNNDYRMVASADQTAQVTNTSAYTDFRTVNGILMPFKELNTAGTQKFTVQYQRFEINPSLPDNVWAKP